MVHFATPKRQTVMLPKVVEPWMCYSQSEELRVQMFLHGYSDDYCGWKITFDTFEREYVIRRGRNTQRFTRKADAYKYARQNWDKK